MVANMTLNAQSPNKDRLPFPPYAFLVPLVLYILIIALLRKHRVRTTLETFPYTSRKTFTSMTLEDAFHIQKQINILEFPFTFLKALQFALFRTYGIPTISKLLVQTAEFTEPATASKRYVDTEVLIAEFSGHHPQSDRAIEAIARMNYIHSHYQRSGKISNDDMLYTLSLFALEPVRWISRYEWRALEDFERCAIGTFWKATGDAMDIDYSCLKGAQEGWIDGLHWLEEVEVWAEEYEKMTMVPDINNHKTAEQTTELLLWYVPQWAMAGARKVVTALMDDRLRAAMMYERPSPFYFTLVAVIFGIRKQVLRHLMPPRPGFLAVRNTNDKPNKGDTYSFNLMDAAPWYIKPTLWNRWGPPSWPPRLMGLPLPGDDGGKYWPQGYRIEDVGPKFMRGKGGDYVKESKERTVKIRMSGCPFARLKAE